MSILQSPPLGASDLAAQLNRDGANVVAIRTGDKAPAHAWKQWQRERQSGQDVLTLPWALADRAGIINGIGGIRSFDFDGCPSTAPVAALLAALGLPADYSWCERSGSGKGFHVWLICDGEIPPGVFTNKAGEPGVFLGESADGSFHRLELRWERNQTIVASSDGHDRWLHGPPIEPPMRVTMGDVINGFFAVARKEQPPAPTAAAAVAYHQDNREAVEAVKERFDLAAYAAMRFPGDVQVEPDGQLRILGNGGLLIDPHRKVWYRFTGDEGGDGIDLVGVALYGDAWDNRDRTKFPEALREAATFAGVNLADYRRAPMPPRAPTPIHANYRDMPPGEPPSEGEESAPFSSRPLTDLGNAERLRERFGDRIRYCPALDTWFIWDGIRWESDATGHIHRFAEATVRAIYAEAADGATPQEREAIGKHAVRSESAAHIGAMISLARFLDDIPVVPSQLDADRWALNCLNGTLDLHTGTLRTHNPTDLITKVCPVVYDPAASLPLWDTFIAQTTGRDDEFAAFLRRAAGYTLVGEPIEEVMFFPFGPAATGKSTFLEALKSALGDYALTADFEAFLKKRSDGGIRSDIARLAGARFVVSIEVDEGKRLAEGLFKTLTGGDTVTARHLYQKEFEFAPQFSLWLAANNAPNVSADDDAMWRRILRLPFTNIVPKEKRDPKIKATLRDPAAAGAAILAWAMHGCLEWQRTGLGVPPAVKEATAEYRREMDPFADFVDACCDLSPQSWTATERIWDVYRQHEGEDANLSPSAKKAFVAHLKSLGCKPGSQRWQGKVVRGWKGLALKDDDLPRGDALGVDGVDGKNTSALNSSIIPPRVGELSLLVSTPSTPSTDAPFIGDDEWESGVIR